MANGRFDYFNFRCLDDFENVHAVTITDSIDNWSRTTDHCANIILRTSDDDGMRTKTYAVWGDPEEGAKINSVVLYRPSLLESPTLGSITVEDNYDRPQDAMDADCAGDEYSSLAT